MRICVVSSELAPFHGWGVGSVIAEYVAGLLAAHHEVTVLADSMPGIERAANPYPGVTLELLKPPSGGRANLPHVPCQHTRRPLLVYECLSKLHAAKRFDAVLFNDFYADAYFCTQARRWSPGLPGALPGAVIATILQSPVTLLREVNQQPEWDLESAALRHLESHAIRGSDVVIASSHAIVRRLADWPLLRDVFAPRIEGVQPAGLPVVRVIWNFLRTASEVQPASAPREDIVFVGRMERRKGLETLVQAAEHVFAARPEATIRVLGTDTDTAPALGSMRKHLDRLMTPGVRARIVFEGNQPRDRVAQAMRDAAVVCVPSLWDNFPTVVLEAMAAGRCVVASDAGGASEIIEDGVSGVLFPSGNADALAHALVRVLSDPHMRIRIGLAGKERVARACDPGAGVEAFVDAIAAGREKLEREVRVSRRETQAATVSAVVPCFNLGAYVGDAVRSLLAQTRPVDEILVVDDGSTDEATRRAVDALAGGPVRVIRQVNRGLSEARNEGIRQAKGNWILPLDADDTVEPRFVELSLAAAERDPTLSMVTSLMACFKGLPSEPDVAYVPLGSCAEALPVCNVAGSAVALIRRDALLDAGCYDREFAAYEDWDVWCALVERGKGIAVIPEMLILNRMRDESMLRSLSLPAQHTARARLIAKHPALLAASPRATRIMLGESIHFQRLWREAEAACAVRASDAALRAKRDVVAENLRYRLADKANALAKRLGLQPLLKRLLGR